MTTMNAIENVVYKDRVLAVIVRARALSELKASGNKMTFATPDHFPFQMGIHARPKGDLIPAHFHNPFPELKNLPVQEFFFVKSGKVKIDLFDERENDAKVSGFIAEAGDTVLLNSGHGMIFLEDTELIELKQGPYRGKNEEKRFVAVVNGRAGGKQ